MFAYLFSPSGRFRRLDFLFIWLGIWLVTIAIGIAFGLSLFRQMQSMALSGADRETILHLAQGSVKGNLAVIMSWLIGLIISWCAAVKRLHDLGRTGWASCNIFFPVHFIALVALAGFVAPIAAKIVGAIWALTTLYYMILIVFVEGTKNDNAYGPSPYHGDAAPTVSQVAMTLGALVFLCVGLSAIGMRTATNLDKMMPPAAVAAAPKRPLTPEEIKAATDALQAKALSGDADAQYEFASLQATGSNGVEKNIGAAIALLERAANQGHAAAQYNLGVFHAIGQYDTPMNNEKAYFWLLLSQRGGYLPEKPDRDYMAIALEGLSPAKKASAEKKADDWKPVMEKQAPPAP